MQSRALPWFIAVGASGSNGLRDIQTLLANLICPLPAVVLVVLHRPWDKPSHLRSILARCSNLPVAIAAEGEKFEAGVIYIGEPEAHLTLAARSFGVLIDDPQQMHRNRNVDLLFDSVAKHAGERMIGVVLSGSLDDGSRGLAAIHAAGGLTMVLTPQRVLMRGMPENAIDYDGPIDTIGGPVEIAEAINLLVAPRASD
ncbi:MAG: chemotaxis protein CheB [Caulobacteraceae bacterium]